MSPQVPAGWYADPYASDLLRWWDGERWTQQVKSVVRTPPAPRPLPTSAPPARGPAFDPARTAAFITRDIGSTAKYSTSSSQYDGIVSAVLRPPPPPWWRTKRILVPLGLLVLLGIGGTIAFSGGETPRVQADEVQPVGQIDPTSSSESTQTTSTTQSPAAPSTDGNQTTLPASTSTVVPSTTSVAPTTSTTAPTTEPPTTLTPTTAPPTTPVPTTVPPTTEPPTTLQDYVTAGSFCSPEGATGETSNGTPMICASTKKDGTPYGEGRNRWRSP